MEHTMRSIILVIFLSVGTVAADMDWETMTIRAAASDRSTAVNLLEQELYALQYDANRTVEDYLRTDFTLTKRMADVLHDNHTIQQHYLTDGGSEYVGEVSIISGALSTLMPAAEPVSLVVPMLCPCCNQPWPRGQAVPVDQELVPQEIESALYSGIVIDCRGFPLTPCLFPRIFNEINEEVFSVNFTDYEYLLQNGLVLYTRQELHGHTRTGDNPMQITAKGVFGNALTDIKISSFDARRIHGSKHNLQLLKECRVAIIIGS
jgi:hypothetical protein